MKEGREGSIHLCLSLLLGSLMGGVGAGTGLYMGPYFPTPQPRNITVHQNTVAYLPCTVKQLGDKTVSWVRRRDADILTVDKYTFVRDERLTVHFTPESDTWTLVIKYVQERDAGTYECQISTEPKMSMFVHLNVIVPQVEVSGAADKYVRSGSSARLECTVSSTVQLPDYIFWYHSGDRLLEYDHPRIKISVSRRGGQGSEMSVTSTLIISNARPSDAGNYTCLPSNLHNATTVLHVLNDEHPAAMHTGRGAAADPLPVWGVVVVVCLVLLVSRSPREERVTLHLPHVLDTEGGGREGDKERRAGRDVPRAASGRVDTHASLTAAGERRSGAGRGGAGWGGAGLISLRAVTLEKCMGGQNSDFLPHLLKDLQKSPLQDRPLGTPASRFL
ncbi:hypothetical protein O3P69_005616 [Scylla paramamosain]|uniref:Ig-like domain-containing protein n=1 Tax=Scylla paramamosain TaxID=85552 RepID=A0AAW0U7D4_SCYPA